MSEVGYFVGWSSSTTSHPNNRLWHFKDAFITSMAVYNPLIQALFEGLWEVRSKEDDDAQVSSALLPNEWNDSAGRL